MQGHEVHGARPVRFHPQRVRILLPLLNAVPRLVAMEQRLRELEAEIRALRKKLEEKDGVIDILKKSVGILSKP